MLFRSAKKYFYDIYFLLQQTTLANMFELFEKKYTNITSVAILKSLTYFEDAAMETELKWFFPFDWETVKKDIIHAVRNVNI